MRSTSPGVRAGNRGASSFSRYLRGARHAGYAVSQRVRKRIEEVFG
jgi:hypothetical protein